MSSNTDLPIAERRIPGEGLSARLSGRVARQPVIGGSAAFRARFEMGDSLEGAWAGSTTDRLVYVSGLPFYEHLARLAEARRRHFLRDERFFEEHGRVRMRAAERHWPGEPGFAARLVHSLLSDSAMVYPPPLAAEHEEAEETQQAPLSGWTGKKPYEPMRPVAQAWGRSSHRPARVIRGGSQRSAASASSREVLAVDVVDRNPRPAPAGLRIASPERLIPSRRPRHLDRSGSRLDAIDLKPVPAPTSRRSVSRDGTSAASPSEPIRSPSSRQLSAARGPASRMVRAWQEAGLPDAIVSSVSIAQGRLASTGQPRRRGLRPALSASPLMATVQAEADETSAIERVPTAEHPAHRSAATRGREARSPRPAATRQAAARAEAASLPPSLSTSPVVRSSRSAPASRKGLLASPVARATAPTGLSRHGTARIAERLDGMRSPAAPGPARRSPRSAPIRTRSGSFVPVATVLPAPIAAGAEPDPSPAPSRRPAPRLSAVDALLPGPARAALAEPSLIPGPKPAKGVEPRQAAATRGPTSPSSVRPTRASAARSMVENAGEVPLVRGWRGAAAHAAARVEAGATSDRSLLPHHRIPAEASSPAIEQLRPATTRAASRIEAGAPVEGSVLPRVQPARTGRRHESVAGVEEIHRGPRPHALTRAASGLFAPAQVVVQQAESSADTAAEVAAPAIHRAPVGIGAAQQPIEAPTRSRRPVQVRASEHAAARTDRALAAELPASRSLLPQLGATEAARPLAIEADHVEAVRAPVVRAFDRQRTLDEDTTRSLLPRPLPHASRRQAQALRLSMAAPTAILASPASIGASTDMGSGSGESAQTPLSDRRAPSQAHRQVAASVSAARRAGRAAAVSGSVRRAAAPSVAPAARTARSGRPSPLAYARLASPVIHLQADQAQALGLFREGERVSGTVSSARSEWLAEGATATAARRAAQEQRRGTARRSAASFAEPEQLLASPEVVQVEVSTEAPDRSAHRASRPLAARPLDWADSRTAHELFAPDAEPPAALPSRSETTDPTRTPRSGRHVARRADGRFVPTIRLRPAMQEPAALGATARAGTPAGAGAALRPMGIPSIDLVMPQAGLPIDGPGLVDPQMNPGAPVVNGWARQAGAAPVLGHTLRAVEEGRDGGALPVWARRASGQPLVRGTTGELNGGLLNALARADSPEDVVRVIVEQGESAIASSSLPQPVIEVIQQIRGEAKAELDEVRKEAIQASAARPARDPRTGKPRSTTRVVKGFTGLRAGSATRRAQGIGADQVMRLAKKLQGLIHLAEGTGDRDAARKQVRMAEDSAAARNEGQGGAATRPGDSHQSQVDIEALGQEVLEAVTRELDLRRERRQEESDERSFWW